MAVGLIYQVAGLIIFRDILVAIPTLMDGTSVVNGDELVPYFNPRSQLLDQARGEYSELTNGFEFRVRYSFLTTWVRHYKILPFAILFMLPMIVWAAYLTTAWFISRVFTSLSKVSIYAGTAFPTGLIYMIVIYAKITHFYTLGVGLCMMTISALTMVEALLFREHRWRRQIVLSCVVALFNPAVHYLILFALFLCLTIATLLTGELAKWVREGGLRRMVSRRPTLRLGRLKPRGRVNGSPRRRGGGPLEEASLGRADSLSRLSESLADRYRTSGDIAHLNTAFELAQRSLELTPETSRLYPERIDRCADRLMSLYEESGDVDDLDASISLGRAAIELTPEGSAVRRARLDKLFDRISARRIAAGEVVTARGAVARSLRDFSNGTTGRCITAIALFVLVAVVPYALFVKFVALRGVENLSETVPGGYYFVRDASVSLVHILAWDLAGIMDKIQFGDYLAKRPRVPNVIYTLLVVTPIAFRPLRRSLFTKRAHRQLLGVLYVNAGFAVWATVGYANPTWFPTFHRSMAATTRALYATDSPVGDLALDISSTIVQVLRFPHRFQLILFMLAPLLMSLPIIWTIEKLHSRALARNSRRRGLAALPRSTDTSTRIAMALAVGSVFFVPFFSNKPYREVYGSGNFSHFATPYPVEDLQEIKSALTALPQGKTVVLPPTETSKLVIDANGTPHKFIDKFYIYYLDLPSYYYGLTGDRANKFEFFLILRGMYYQQDWWINIARDIGIEYIILNKQIEDNRGVGAEYLPKIETYLREQIEALPQYIDQVAENESFVLYSLDNDLPVSREVLLFDLSWNEFLDSVFARLDLSSCYDFQYISNYEGTTTEPVHLLASDPESAAINMWVAGNRDAFFGLSSKILAFNPDIISSSYYLSPMFRLFLFFSDTKWNRTEMITPGIFGTMQGSFFGVPRPTQFTIPTVVPEAGRYRVLLRAGAPANEVVVTAPSLDYAESFELRSPSDALKLFDSELIYEPDRAATDVSSLSVAELEERIPGELVPVNFRYVYHDLGVIDAPAGPHTFVFDKTDANPMLVEGIALIPEDRYQGMTIPDDVHLVESIDELDCSQTSPVRHVSRNAYLDPAANGPHADLTNEQLYELLGLEELAPPDPSGIGGQWIHLMATLALVLACMGVIRWRTRLLPEDLD